GTTTLVSPAGQTFAGGSVVGHNVPAVLGREFRAVGRAAGRGEGARPGRQGTLKNILRASTAFISLSDLFFMSRNSHYGSTVSANGIRLTCRVKQATILGQGVEDHPAIGPFLWLGR